MSGVSVGMTNLERITVEYVPQEDRVRLSGQRPGAAPLAIWLTRRLLDRLLPELVKWIENEAGDLPAAKGSGAKGRQQTVPRADVLQGFAQQAARERATPQPPVRVAPEDETWLVHTVSISRGRSKVRLTFKSADGRTATVTLAPPLLRQWLNILHDTYRKADWPLQVWPDWIGEAGSTARSQPPVRH
jgi:hypothetical protein